MIIIFTPFKRPAINRHGAMIAGPISEDTVDRCRGYRLSKVFVATECQSNDIIHVKSKLCCHDVITLKHDIIFSDLLRGLYGY